MLPLDVVTLASGHPYHNVNFSKHKTCVTIYKPLGRGQATNKRFHSLLYAARPLYCVNFVIRCEV